MSRRFAEIAFSPSVQKMQSRLGSRKVYENWDEHAFEGKSLSINEKVFIEERDSFYQASVNNNGWPYVQFKGGPKGFLKVLDEQTIAYADFRGNVQYVSLGNFQDNQKVALVLMDYAEKRRLKIYATAEVVEVQDDPELIARLEDANYRARIERALVLRVEAFDWNCPRHITPRYTQAEIDRQIAPLLEIINQLDGKEE